VTLYWLPLPQTEQAPAAGEGADAGPAAGWPLRLSAGIDALLLMVLAMAAGVAPRWTTNDPAFPAFGAALQRSGLPLGLAGVLALTSLALLLLLLPGRWPASRRWLWLPNLAGFLAVLGLVLPPIGPLLDRERQLPLRQLARHARQVALPEEPLWVVGTKRYSLIFYGGETATFISDRPSVRRRLREAPGSLGLVKDSRSVRLIGDRTTLEKLDLPVAEVKRLARRGEQELWRVPRATLEIL
jgi:hypothetical protein